MEPEKLYLNFDEIKHLSDILAQKIAADCADLSQATLVAVSRGGLIPAQLIAYKLNIRDIRVMKLISYDEDNTRQEIKDISTDRLFDGADVYFIDDLADSGATVRYIRKKFPTARLCSLLEKTCCNKHPDITAREGIKENTWVIFPWD
ncbi:MAG: hypothetical protein J6J35_08255 [Alphaproteobacteria bacterium]|nr:hypothetical protein [Alphaproteobacteria bacterium]